MMNTGKSKRQKHLGSNMPSMIYKCLLVACLWLSPNVVASPGQGSVSTTAGPQITTAPIIDSKVQVSQETAINLAALLASLSAQIPTMATTESLEIDTTAVVMATTSINTAISSTTTNPATLPTATTSLFAASPYNGSSTSKTTTVVLVIVFSAIGVTLLILALLLFKRYRHRQYPFHSLASLRAVTPIDDEEIDSWRRRGSNSSRETKAMSQTSLSILTMTGRNGDLWPLPEIQRSPCYGQDTGTTTLKSPFLTYANEIPTSPSNAIQIAQAPNARFGLTTDIRAGDVAYISSTSSMKRHSSCSRSKRLPSFSRTITGGVGSVTMTGSGAVYSGYSKSRASSLSSTAWSEWRMGLGDRDKDKAKEPGTGIRDVRPATAKTETIDRGAWFDPEDERVRRLLERGESYGGRGSLTKGGSR